MNHEGSLIAREMNFPEGDVNSQINLALNHLSLGEPDRAREHLSAAETLLADDEWFRWVYTIRFHAAYAEYWLSKGDPAEAARCANGVPRARQRDTPAQAHRVGAQTARRRRRDGGPTTRSRRVLSGGAVPAAASPVSLGPVEDFGCTRCHSREAPSISGDDTLACGHATCASGTRRVDQGRSTADSLQTVESRTRVWSHLIDQSG